MARAIAQRSFVFIAAKPAGGTSFGLRQAQSQRALAAALRRERLVLTRTLALPEWLSFDRPMSLKDQAALNEQLKQLVGRGVPLVEALDVAKSIVSKAQQPRVGRIRDLVAGGASFADACQQAGGFDRVTVSIYRAAERTGDLADAAGLLSQDARRRMAVSGKAATLAVYPVIVLVIGLAAGLLLLTFIVPRIGQSLASSGLELPAFTELTMNVGLWIRGNAGLLAMAIAILGVLALILRTAVGRVVGAVTRRTPLLKTVLLIQELVRFFSGMAAMSRSGVPIADALGIVTNAVSHARLRDQLIKLRAKLVQGGVLTTLIDGVTELPLPTRKLLIAADKAGDLESAFEALSDDMAIELDKQTTRLLAALEPLLLVLLFVVIGTIMVSVMLPMLTLVAQQL
ncbi:MAG: type II secretion system F family protein [Planctomycetota bacterium]